MQGGLIGKSDDSIDYTLKHATRQFIIAADSLSVFDLDVTFAEASKFLPNRTGQVAELGELTLAHIRKELGVDPLFLSCHACFAQMFTEDHLRAFLDLPYSELYADLAASEESRLDGGDAPAAASPTFYSLVSAALKMRPVRY